MPFWKELRLNPHEQPANVPNQTLTCSLVRVSSGAEPSPEKGFRSEAELPNRVGSG